MDMLIWKLSVSLAVPLAVPLAVSFAVSLDVAFTEVELFQVFHVRDAVI